MPLKQTFKLIYAPIFKTHLNTIEPKYYSLVREVIENQLSLDPDLETRNRKPLKRPVLFESTWELRFGPGNRFRVFYQPFRDSHTVHILAIGEKIGNRLFIGGKEVES